LRSSLGRATLDAKIRRRLGVKLDNLHTIRTVRELEAALAAKQPGTSTPAPHSGPLGGVTQLTLPSEPKFPQIASTQADLVLACGIDVELVSAMPEARDFWEETFYRTNFTSAEIAYCISQTNPSMHFAARWCAKEAFKKCFPVLVSKDMSTIEVARREDGSPYLRLLGEQLSITSTLALSLAHTEDWAVAIVIAKPEVESVGSMILSPLPRGGLLLTGLSIAALLCSLVALALALTRL
jgi:phosphopantetheine--protein transferase-like protein